MVEDQVISIPRKTSKVKIALVVALAAVIAFLGIGYRVDHERDAFNISPSDARTIADGLADYAKDSSSTTITRLAASPGDGLVDVCGLVNGRNSFGGYAGNTLFKALYNRRTGKVSSPIFADTGTFDHVLKLCVQDGVFPADFLSR